MAQTNFDPHRNLAAYLGLVARGFCMGAADIVPGVSGGTMAFILGIYEELLHSIKSIDGKLLRLLIHFEIRAALAIFPWRFLASLAAGILLAILSLAPFLETQLEEHPSIVWAFFFGLVLASVISVSRSVKHWSASAIATALIACAVGYILVGAAPASSPDSPWYLFLTGALAVCAMILPGISGAFIMVLLGKYHYVLAAVTNRDIPTLAVVIAGAAVGMVTFARILSWLFSKHQNLTIASLTGLMLGSLRKVWPWKQTLSPAVDQHGNAAPLEEINVIPTAFQGEVRYAVMMVILGLVFVLIVTWLAEKRGQKGTT